MRAWNSDAPGAFKSVVISSALTAGDTLQLTATGTFDDGSKRALVAPEVTFTSSLPDAATVSGAGLVTTHTSGFVTITAAAKSGAAVRSASVTISISEPVFPLAISITGQTRELAVGGTVQLNVTVSYSDGSHTILPAGVTLTSLAPSLATVTAAGLVTGVAPGLTSITASLAGSFLTSITVSVVGPGLDVFIDKFAAGLDFVPFEGTALSTQGVDAGTLLANGHKTVRFDFAAAGSTIGGALVASAPIDLSAYDAITFWAKSSAPLTLETVGLANNASTKPGGNDFSVETSGLSLTTTFTQFTVPLPLPGKLKSIDGLFHFADAQNHSAATTLSFWLGDLRYQKLGATATGTPAPAFTLTTRSLPAGQTFTLLSSDLQIAWTAGALASLPLLLRPSLKYFTYSSSDPSVATVSSAGVVTGLKAGTASLTAKLDLQPTSNPLVLTITP